MKTEIYNESKKLKKIIESKGWQLFDSFQLDAKTKPLSWEQQEEIGPAKVYEIGHNYVFAPIPEKGQTLRQAYSITKGFGPSLLIENPEEDRWRVLYLISGRFQMGLPIIFTRLDFQEKFLGAHCPESSFLPDYDKVGVRYDYAIDTFQKFFKILQPESEGIMTPVKDPEQFN